MEAIRVVLFSEVNSKLGSPFLSMLHGHPQVDLAAVVTSPPGRRCAYFVDDPSCVDLEKQGAALGVPVLRPASVNAPDFVAGLRELRADYFVVGNFQQIMKAALLSVPGTTTVNFHPSPLPRYAGLAPFYWMVRNGETDGSVTVIDMDAGLDTGDVIMQHHMPLSGTETGIGLRTAQERANVLMLLDLIPLLADRSYRRVPQDLSRRSYFGRPADADYRLDFTLPVADVERRIRAAYRHPGAWALDAGGARTVVLSSAPGEPSRAPVDPGRPGAVVRNEHGVFVACADDWLQVLTVEDQGDETPSEHTGLLPDGSTLTSPRTPESVTA